jgi:hypothetical protein
MFILTGLFDCKKKFLSGTYFFFNALRSFDGTKQRAEVQYGAQYYLVVVVINSSLKLKCCSNMAFDVVFFTVNPISSTVTPSKVADIANGIITLLISSLLPFANLFQKHNFM